MRDAVTIKSEGVTSTKINYQPGSMIAQSKLDLSQGFGLRKWLQRAVKITGVSDISGTTDPSSTSLLTG